MPELGHVVFYVKDLERSVSFYRDVVGLDEVGRIFQGRAALLSGGRSHHELLLIQVGDSVPGPLQGKRIGLYHTAWKVGDSLDQLKAALDIAQSHGCIIQGIADHTVSQSIYLLDPDGNEVEVFVDDPEIDWQRDTSWMEAPVKPLRL